MNISTNYDYSKYTQYNNLISSMQGQQRIHNGKDTQSTDSSQQILKIAGDSTQATPANKFINPLDSLVEDGTITEDQKKAIDNALELSRRAYQAQPGATITSNTFKNPLDGLVEAGTITEDQATAINNTFDSAKKAHRMPPSPPQFIQSEDSDSMTNILNNLVEDGAITSEQLSVFESAIKAYESQLFSDDDTYWSSFDSQLK